MYQVAIALHVRLFQLQQSRLCAQLDALELPRFLFSNLELEVLINSTLPLHLFYTLPLIVFSLLPALRHPRVSVSRQGLAQDVTLGVSPFQFGCGGC